VGPVLAVQAYVWLVPHERPRAVDAGFGVLVILAVLLTVRRRPPTRAEAGLGPWAEQRRSILPLALFTAAATAALLLGGWATETLRLRWDVLKALAAYPLWGAIQCAYFLVFALPRLRSPLAVALLFALAHTPNPVLMAGGGVMMLVFALVWRRAPSLPVTAISHGVIGAVLGKMLHVSTRIGAWYWN
jgi:predicted neutral ceramidase superfamily lipid hydrolase